MVVTSLQSPFIPIEAALVNEPESAGGETGTGNSDFLHEYKKVKVQNKKFCKVSCMFFKIQT